MMQRAMLRYYMCLRTQHTSKECCVHSKTFFQGKTCSKYYYIYPFERNSTIFLNMLHHLMQYVRYSFKRVLHPFKDFLSVRLFQSTTTASIDAFYYTETVHSFTTFPTGLNYFTQCVRYSLNQILHSMKDFLYR